MEAPTLAGVLVKDGLWEGGSQLSYGKHEDHNSSAKPMFFTWEHALVVTVMGR